MRSIRLTAVIIASTASAFVTLASQSIPQDRGAPGAWQKILKLRTTVSVLHATAHPDDEHGGVLARLSRGDGARVILLTLTRGESGDNAIGPQLFDALALIRTEELLTADKYYGVEEQYFSTMIDFGFSKRLDETTEKWGLENALRDVVRLIRITRPWIVISRFQGNARDGHGNHSASGLLSQQASEAAGDASRFPEQIAEGLRPWSPLKVYIGGVRVDEKWTLRIDSGAYSPWLGDSYANIASLGLSFQRSQNGGRYVPVAGTHLFVLHADGVPRDSAGQGDLDLRRHRYELRGPVQDARPNGASGCGLGARSNRRRRCTRGLRLSIHRSGVFRRGTCGRTQAHARRDCEIRERTRRGVCTAHQGTAIPGGDKRCARRWSCRRWPRRIRRPVPLVETAAMVARPSGR